MGAMTDFRIFRTLDEMKAAFLQERSLATRQKSKPP
jgi:hypothetical protein